MRKFIALILLVVLGVALSACDDRSTGDQAESRTQAQATTNVVQNQPIPVFMRSQMRQNLIEIETAQANGVQSTTFFFNQGVQDPIFVCPSIGTPIAASMSLSNPQQIQYSDSHGSGVVAQMDPNGVYTGATTGTYVMCIGADGKPFAKYWEGFVDTIFGPAIWDPKTHSEQLVGPPSFNFSRAK